MRYNHNRTMINFDFVAQSKFLYCIIISNMSCKISQANNINIPVTQMKMHTYILTL